MGREGLARLGPPRPDFDSPLGRVFSNSPQNRARTPGTWAAQGWKWISTPWNRGAPVDAVGWPLVGSVGVIGYRLGQLAVSWGLVGCGRG